MWKSGKGQEKGIADPRVVSGSFPDFRIPRAFSLTSTSHIPHSAFPFPMDVSQLTDRAMQIRQRFAELERSRHGRAWTREEIMQGFVGDVGDLMKLVMAKAGTRHVDDADAK